MTSHFKTIKISGKFGRQQTEERLDSKQATEEGLKGNCLAK